MLIFKILFIAIFKCPKVQSSFNRSIANILEIGYSGKHPQEFKIYVKSVKVFLIQFHIHELEHISTQTIVSSRRSAICSTLRNP